MATGMQVKFDAHDPAGPSNESCGPVTADAAAASMMRLTR